MIVLFGGEVVLDGGVSAGWLVFRVWGREELPFGKAMVSSSWTLLFR